METQDSSLKHLKESSRKHQLAQASNNNIIKERLLPITSREGNILFLAVFLKLPYSHLCKAEVCGRSDTTGFPVTWSHQQTHAWNTEWRPKFCKGTRNQYYSIHLDIG